MHLDVAPDGFVERAGLWSGQVPVPLVQVTFGMGYARAIVAGTRLGIFDALARGPLDAQALAEQTGCALPGLRALANALVGFGVLTRRDGLYANARGARRWLAADAERSLRQAVLFLGYCQELLTDLEDKVRTGRVDRLHDRDHPPEFWEAYLGGLAAFANIAAQEVVRRVRLPARPRRLLDVGGGHGLYAAAWCRRFSDLAAEVLDLPGACAAGRAIVAAEGMAERVRFREGDMREGDWGQGYDVVLLFNVLHNATEREGRDLFRRAHDALAPGCALVVCDAVHRAGRLDANAGWNELFFYLVSGAQAWPEEALRGWMADVGFGSFRRTGLLVVPNFVLVARRG